VYRINVLSKKTITHGNGFLIKNNNHFFIVTNAHVCLGKYKSDLYPINQNNWLLIDKIESSATIQYEILFKKKNVTINTTLSKINYNIKKDLCLIKVFPENEEYLIIKNDLNIKYTNDSFFLSQRTTNKKNIGKYIGTQNKNIKLPLIANGKKKYYESNLTTIYWYNFNAHSGDSGSPVFSQGNLIGILFAIDKNGNGAIIPIQELYKIISQIPITRINSALIFKNHV